MEDPKPSIGRVVHYRLIDLPPGREIAAAMVVRVEPGDPDVVDLHVMHPRYQVPDTHEMIPGGCFTAINVKKGGGAGQWGWPPRVQ